MRERVKRQREGPDGATEYLCSTCGAWKPRDGFYRNRSRLNGISYNCKPCVAQKSREWEGRTLSRGERQARREAMLDALANAVVVELRGRGIISEAEYEARHAPPSATGGEGDDARIGDAGHDDRSRADYRPTVF